ncbi:MAG: LEPR-XLL domain-containing protein, partial [Myxococcota bacterium]
MNARAIRRSRRAARRRRKPDLRLESLEARILLAGDPFLASQAVLRDGLEGLADLGDSLAPFGEIGDTLQVIGTSIGDAVDVAGVVRDRIVDPIRDVLDFATEPTSEVLEAALRAQLGFDSGGLSVEVRSASLEIVEGNELAVDLVVEVARTTGGHALDLGPGLDAFGVSLDPATVPVTGRLLLDFSFGVDLADDLFEAEDFFLRINDFTLDAEVAFDQLGFDFELGFLEFSGSDGSVELDAGLRVDFANPDGDAGGNLSSAELADTPIADLVDVAVTDAVVVARLPIQTTLVDFAQLGDPAVFLEQADVFAGDPTELRLEALEPLEELNAAIRQAFVEGTQTLSERGGELGRADELGTDLFPIGGSIGEFLDLGTTLETRLAQPVADFLATSNLPTLDQLVAELEGLGGTFGDLTFSVAAAGQTVGDRLEVDLTLSGVRATAGVEVGLGEDAADLLILEGLTGALETGFDWSFTLGVDLLGLRSSGDAFFGRFPTPLAITADLDLPSVTTAARTGLLGLTVGTVNGNQSSIRLDADVDVTLIPSGDVSLATLIGAALDELFDQTGTAQVDLSLFAQSDVPGIADDPLDPAFVSLSDDLYDGSPSPFVHNLDSQDVLDFNALPPTLVLSGLTQFAGFLRDF